MSRADMPCAPLAAGVPVMRLSPRSAMVWIRLSSGVSWTVSSCASSVWPPLTTCAAPVSRT